MSRLQKEMKYILQEEVNTENTSLILQALADFVEGKARIISEDGIGTKKIYKFDRT
jgi:hypothetical protein